MLTNRQSIETIVNNTINSLKQFMEVDTVIGKPINVSPDRVIIPVSKVNIGFLVGGGEYSETQPKKMDKNPYAGGSGAGVSVTPVGFLVVDSIGQTMIKIDDSTSDKWADALKATVNSIRGMKH